MDLHHQTFQGSQLIETDDVDTAYVEIVSEAFRESLQLFRFLLQRFKELRMGIVADDKWDSSECRGIISEPAPLMGCPKEYHSTNTIASLIILGLMLCDDESLKGLFRKNNHSLEF